MTTPFIAAEDLAVYLRLDVNQNTGSLANDELAQIAIDSGCQVVRDYCAQDFILVTDDVVRLDGTGRGSLLLPQLPVSSVSSVITSPDDDDEVTLEATDYVIDEAGILWQNSRHACWPVGHQNIEVTYTHGYAAVPSSVRIVALQVAARIYDIGMMEQESTGAWSGSYVQGAGSLTPFEERALYFYRRAA